MYTACNVLFNRMLIFCLIMKWTIWGVLDVTLSKVKLLGERLSVYTLIYLFLLNVGFVLSINLLVIVFGALTYSILLCF